jgi:methionine-rich copper-binding protein CopC
LIRLPVLAGALLLACAIPAASHSLLLGSVPASRAVLSAPPAHVELRFNNRIEKALSGVQIVGARDQRFAGMTLPDGPPDRLRASVPPLPPGEYRVEWRVLSTDGHIVTGTYPFTVRP